MDLTDIMNHSRQWPQWVIDLFPLTFIYYKKNKSKKRKRPTGFKNVNGKTVKVYEDYKRSSTSKSNDYPFITVTLKHPDDWGTIDRHLKHTGYGKIVSVVYPTEDELKYCGEWRYMKYKFKSASELYNLRGLDDPKWKEIADRIDNNYPSHASGQLRLL